MIRQFRQVDVFTTVPYRGNPVAVVLGGDGLSTEEMQRFANWTNLSETTFVVQPTAAEADYQLRIFTPSRELSFAGHPTLGSCHAWLEAGHRPRRPGLVVQQCGVGLVPIRRLEAGLAFAAPPVLRGEPVDEALAVRLAAMLGIARGDIAAARWADNGPGWIGVMLESAEAVLALRPPAISVDVGVFGPYPPGSPEAFEVRAFFRSNGVTVEDPVCGSFNASLARWLLSAGLVRAPYVVSQGTVLGRRGRVHVGQDADGEIWIGGGAVTSVTGVAEL
ncbi:MAG TPA: PhzF family phenazine biosynthesis protein [Trebonia sp.]